MSWSEPAPAGKEKEVSRLRIGPTRSFRALVLAGLLLGLAAPLGACSFTPVYGGTSRLASQPLLNFAYAKPNSRLEQIVYQELALRFGSSRSETAPLATVTVSSSVARVGYSITTNPNKTARVTVTARLVITTRDGSDAEPIEFTRQASADYTGSDQLLAINAADTEASERATKAAAESLRLAVLAALSR